MHVKELVSRVTGRAVRASGILGRRTRLTLAVVVAALLAGPLATGDGELVFLNAVGLGLGDAAAQAVHQARRQAAAGTGAAGTMATGNEHATAATDGNSSHSNSIRRRTR